MQRVLLPLTLAFFGACSAITAADVIYLTNGGKVRGRIVEETSRQIVMKTAGGTTVLLRDEVATIERGATIEELYAERLAKIDPASASARFDLGRWLEDQGDRVRARREFKKVLKLDPDHAPARAKLGYVRQEGAWVKPLTAKASSRGASSAPRARASRTPSHSCATISSAARLRVRPIRPVAQKRHACAQPTWPEI